MSSVVTGSATTSGDCRRTSAGESAKALAIGEANDRIPAGDRSADERFMTLALLHYVTRAAGQIADSLQYGHRLLSLAETMDSDEHRAHALHNLGALQADTFNVEDAVVLQERALALARKLGATELPAPFTGDLLYTYAALNEHDKAYRTLSEWLAQPGGVTAADRHHQCAPIALSYLGAGLLEEAEQALALGPLPSSDRRPPRMLMDLGQRQGPLRPRPVCRCPGSVHRLPRACRRTQG